jgi:hypothetical protein
VPFIRQTRDKRGFEQTLVMHAYHPPGGGPSRPRVLYLFRTPANLRVGRKPLDSEVMEALEHTHPDLSFDWNALARDQVVSRPDPLDRASRRAGGRDERPRRPPRQEPEAAAPRAVAPVPDDQSLLGRVLGAAEASRLRQRHSEITQRIGRRAQTPEDRTRLLERAQRLNPDDWTDEATIRARSATVEGAWREILLELPSRRRGRRGGRRQGGDRTPSAIMAGDSQNGEDVHDSMGETGPSGADRRDGNAGGGPADGPDTAEAAERPGDPGVD